MAGIDKLRTSNYSDYNEFRLWCIKNKNTLISSMYDPFLTSKGWYALQQDVRDICYGKNNKDIEVEKMSLVIANFTRKQDKYLYWHCPLNFIRGYLEKQCGFKKANWFVKLFWRK